MDALTATVPDQDQVIVPRNFMEEDRHINSVILYGRKRIMMYVHECICIGDRYQFFGTNMFDRQDSVTLKSGEFDLIKLTFDEFVKFFERAE
jgi:hypothetical protein